MTRCSTGFRAAALALLALGASCKTPNPAGSGSEIKEGFDSYNRPSAFNMESVRYDTIPSSGRLSTVPWAGYYWATYRGGIAYRWTQHLNRSSGTLGNMSHRDFSYTPYSANQARSLTEAQIRGLSPAEKYDLLTDDFSFGLTSQQKQMVKSAVQADGEIPTWFGLCHAWAPAAALTPYPGNQVKIKNRAGQCITFYRDDLKALVTAAYDSSFGGQYNTVFLGQRCNLDPANITRDSLGRIAVAGCRDTNPGAFHVVITSLIANNKPAVLDVTFSDEVWNQPIYGYSFNYSNRRALSASDPLRSVRAAGTTQLVDVDFKLDYVVESVPSMAQENLRDYIQSVTYYYTLELDAQGMILGGEWRVQRMSNASVRIPDFVWAPASGVSNTGRVKLAEIDKLVRYSLSANADQCANQTPPPSPTQPDVPTPVDGQNPNPDSPIRIPTLPDGDQVVIVPPKVVKFNPYIDVRTRCPEHETRYQCESDGTSGCVWNAASSQCNSLASNRCLDFKEENVCRAKGGDCRWQGGKCENVKVLEQRQAQRQ